jgi:hypothetical protein
MLVYQYSLKDMNKVCLSEIISSSKGGEKSCMFIMYIYPLKTEDNQHTKFTFKWSHQHF